MSVIDEYLNTVSPEQQALLAPVRDELRRLLPGAEEVISYGLPCFKVGGKAVGGFAANKNFCSYYPFSGTLLSTIASEITGFSHTKSALHFSNDNPLSNDLLALLVATRLAEIQNK